MPSPQAAGHFLKAHFRGASSARWLSMPRQAACQYRRERGVDGHFTMPRICDALRHIMMTKNCRGLYPKFPWPNAYADAATWPFSSHRAPATASARARRLVPDASANQLVAKNARGRAHLPCRAPLCWRRACARLPRPRAWKQAPLCPPLRDECLPRMVAR